MSNPSPVEAGRRVLRLEAAGMARAAERLDERFAAAVDLLAGGAGTGHRLGGRQVGPDRAQDGGDPDLDRDTGDLPAPGRQPARRPGHRGPRRRGDPAQQERRERRAGGTAGRRSSASGCRSSPSPGAATRCWAAWRAVVLDGSVEEEACPHDLAPTTSTTVALALGDALAVALMERRGFRPDDFAAIHPGRYPRPPAAAPGHAM